MVIGPTGENLGKMSSRSANELAASYDLDLYCVAPNANPPVCKIVNYGKLRYEKQKSERAQRKNSKAATLKEIQLHQILKGIGLPQIRKNLIILSHS